MKKKWICTVCGYVHEGDEAPEFCPQCKQPKSKFKELVETEGALQFVDEHVLGVAKGVDPVILEGLNAHFMGECTEVGMYLAMSRQADREGYPEVAEAFKRYAWEEAEHAAKFAELLGDVVWDTKTNLKKRMEAEAGACEDKKRIATLAKQQNLDAIHDTVHEMCKDEARHGKDLKVYIIVISSNLEVLVICFKEGRSVKNALFVFDKVILAFQENNDTIFYVLLYTSTTRKDAGVVERAALEMR